MSLVYLHSRCNKPALKHCTFWIENTTAVLKNSNPHQLTKTLKAVQSCSSSHICTYIYIYMGIVKNASIHLMPGGNLWIILVIQITFVRRRAARQSESSKVEGRGLLSSQQPPTEVLASIYSNFESKINTNSVAVMPSDHSTVKSVWPYTGSIGQAALVGIVVHESRNIHISMQSGVCCWMSDAVSSLHT